MWICLNDAFLSIVAKDCPPDHLLVRARRKGDIERVLPGVTVTESRHTDYRWRAAVPRQRVVDAIAQRLLAIDYGNFKNSVTDRALHDAYARVWGAMYTLQRG
ncbi:hypothetical protein Tfont_01603 [Tepidimonas fonticaldi]|jgi:hypothetical protein|uniref:Uncharacterized protein n=1 Tax=Tepidimonas fonticaldi TaxID=1101373 RepID=A0A554XM37_9BURK|nr:hypothetical protein [Tepidimonas fonticaldi]TSE36891.1 hypothetical protein Tfont_01603 [Tepidimonas fonticaldi]